MQAFSELEHSPSYLCESIAPSELEIWREVVLDCQKKTVSVLRQMYAETVHTLVSTTRKALLVKVKTGGSDHDESSELEGHAQRHVRLLVDLLGQFSNIVAQMCCLRSSRDLLQLLVTPFCRRVADVAFGN
jgi:hypothetical protein